MNKILKTGILASVLVIPVFILIYLYSFGENKFSIPVMFPEDSMKVKGKYVVTRAQVVPDFRFQTQSGSWISSKDLSNSIYVAGLFYTNCPEACKEKNAQLVRVQESFRSDTALKILSFTIDPDYDDLNVLKNYAQKYRAMNGKWFFLRGSKDSIYTLSEKGFHLSAAQNRDAQGKVIPDSRFVLVDKKGWVRGFYDGTNKKEVDRLITEIAILLKEYEK